MSDALEKIVSDMKIETETTKKHTDVSTSMENEWRQLHYVQQNKKQEKDYWSYAKKME